MSLTLNPVEPLTLTPHGHDESYPGHLEASGSEVTFKGVDGGS